MKLGDGALVEVSVVLFPRLKERGLIEADVKTSFDRGSAEFPRLKERGLIEAYFCTCDIIPNYSFRA